MTRFDYDLFTIGAGSGGVRASRMAGQFGAKVGIAENYRIGGTCVIVNAELGTTALTLPPEPEVFWQCTQWQARSSVTGTSTV